MEDELFFVGIRDPIELRKELLTSSKNLIDSLRRYEAYKDVKEEKLQNIMGLKRVFDELLVLNKKLRNKLPQIPIKASPTIMREERASVKGKPIKMSRNKIDVLEDELAKIEERLGSLE
jgi:hypothetical protein